jgi:tetratricopeptide (TPR) repeat protein
LRILLLLSAIGPQKAFPESGVSFRVHAGRQIPDQGEYFSSGLDLEAALDWRMLSFFGASLQGGYSMIPTLGSKSVSILDARAGPFLLWRPLSRFSLAGEITGGLYSASWNERSISGLSMGARISANWHLTPSISLAGFGSVKKYAYSPSALMNTITAGVGVSINLSEALRNETRIRMEKLSQNMVFPVSYAWYNENPFAVVRITNNEPNDITMVNTSFFMEQYMSQPKLCGTTAVLKPGQSVDVPVTAFFNESMMALTENIAASGRIIVDYRSLGTAKQARIAIEIPVYHRNAMSWDDDRRAAAFVSARDPAALWFSRYVSSVVQSRLRPGISRNIQYALGLFETLKVYGINYVVDPSSSYIELSASGTSLDSLNYPYQTLMYRGGDCDDLAILFSSLLEAAGIETAFITIPGHIYMAFDLGMTEAEARRDFYAPQYLIFDQGRAWVPLEITIPGEGFYRAWRIGLKQWSDNDRRGAARIFPMHESWKLYPPVSVPGASSRLVLPGEAETALAFDRSANEYVEAEIRSQLLAIRSRQAAGGESRTLNEEGVLYGRYGVLDKAIDRFRQAARQGNVHSMVNLGNAAFLQQRRQEAVSYYQEALALQPDNALALLGLARCSYEINDFRASDTYYAGVRRLDPELAAQYAYLASFFESRGRGFSLADRLGNAPWSLPAAPAEAAPPAPPGRELPAAPPGGIPSPREAGEGGAGPYRGLTGMLSIGGSRLGSAFIGPPAAPPSAPAPSGGAPGPSGEPSEASREPSGPSREPSGPSGEPSEASREPSGPSREPSEASREPSEASREPSEASRDLSEPSRGLSEAPRDLSEPSGGLSESSRELSEASRELSESSRELSESSRELSESSRDLSEPSRDLSEPSRDLSESSRDLSEPSRDLSESSRGLSESSRDLSEASRDLSGASGDLSGASGDLSEASGGPSGASGEPIEASGRGGKPRSALWWVLGGIATAGGLVLLAAGKAGRKPGSRQERSSKDKAGNEDTERG